MSKLHNRCMFNPKLDIAGRAEIETLVNTFYERVRGDDLLGFIFNDVAQTNWAAHLPKMYAFWETVLFRSGGYTGNPLAAHAKLVTYPGAPHALTDTHKERFNADFLAFARS